MNTTSHRLRDLDTIQRWMQVTVMHPAGVSQGIASAEARRHIDVGPANAESVVNRSHNLTSLERLAIYGYAYYTRLLECLSEEFPVLKHALGEEVFDAFVAEYLAKYPSRSYTLFHLGLNFPRYLAETRPDLDQQQSATTNWPDFLIDLAQLELTFNEIFDGPGVEGEELLDPGRLVALTPDQLLGARLVGVPCLRLLALRYPVHRYFTAVRRKLDPAMPEPAETWLAVTRHNYVVRHYELSRASYELLSDLLAGETFAQAIGRAVEAAGPNSSDLTRNLRKWFHSWAAEGFIRDLQIAG